MLTTYFKTPRTLEHSHAGLAGSHLDACAGWLEAQRYRSRRLRHLLRGAHRFSCWAHSTGFSMHALDVQALEVYGHHLQGLQRLRYPSGRYSHLFVGARHLVRFLETAGVVAPAASILPPPPEPCVFSDFKGN